MHDLTPNLTRLEQHSRWLAIGMLVYVLVLIGIFCHLAELINT